MKGKEDLTWEDLPQCLLCLPGFQLGSSTFKAVGVTIGPTVCTNNVPIIYSAVELNPYYDKVIFTYLRISDSLGVIIKSLF